MKTSALIVWMLGAGDAVVSLARADDEDRPRPCEASLRGWRRCRDTDVSMTGPGRCQMRVRVVMAVLGSLVAIATVATADQISALLTGYEEPPVVSTTGRGEFTATLDADGDPIPYSLTFSGLQGTVTQGHIHVGQLSVNGSIVIFLCQTAVNPDPTGLAPQCPEREGTVTGTITAANVIAGSMAQQQLAAGDLAAVLTAIRAGAAYVNVHTDISPGGEIRGQIRTIAK
jgi:CHRD domain